MAREIRFFFSFLCLMAITAEQPENSPSSGVVSIYLLPAMKNALSHLTTETAQLAPTFLKPELVQMLIFLSFFKLLVLGD